MLGFVTVGFGLWWYTSHRKPDGPPPPALPAGTIASVTITLENENGRRPVLDPDQRRTKARSRPSPPYCVGPSPSRTTSAATSAGSRSGQERVGNEPRHPPRAQQNALRVPDYTVTRTTTSASTAPAFLSSDGGPGARPGCLEGHLKTAYRSGPVRMLSCYSLCQELRVGVCSEEACRSKLLLETRQLRNS